MSSWKDTFNTKSGSTPEPNATPATALDAAPAATAPLAAVPAAQTKALGKESLISADLAIEGKIEGSGHVRIAGKFKGDVNVQGDLTIELGAKVTGSVKAKKVSIAGELEGNIDSATQVDVLASGSVVGDIKASTVTVASGAKLRGQVDFGWGEKKDA